MMVTGGLSKIRSFRVRRDGPKGNNNVPLNTVADEEDGTPVSQSNVCKGADLEKRAKLRKDGSVDTTTCKYCYNAHARPIRKESSWQCSACKTCLCVTCNYRYHRWLLRTDM